VQFPSRRKLWLQNMNKSYAISHHWMLDIKSPCVKSQKSSTLAMEPLTGRLKRRKAEDWSVRLNGSVRFGLKRKKKSISNGSRLPKLSTSSMDKCSAGGAVCTRR